MYPDLYALRDRSELLMSCGALTATSMMVQITLPALYLILGNPFQLVVKAGKKKSLASFPTLASCQKQKMAVHMGEYEVSFAFHNTTGTFICC